MNQTTINTKQLSAWRMLWLHLWPGVLGLIITLISEPVRHRKPLEQLRN